MNEMHAQKERCRLEKLTQNYQFITIGKDKISWKAYVKRKGRSNEVRAMRIINIYEPLKVEYPEKKLKKIHSVKRELIRTSISENKDEKF
jgi:hypothetical protein